ncbi:hypothetical protein ES674_08085 [Bizionia myxarmorum]|uniref:Carboxypeptidase-like regulatory domain-containing protein n=2 Tax=Bizionia myxarmorum TaxID=291186 RepID=A0A5D0RGV5_9FLAO|nr:hypothetical protein ES674_08085 [Bizionia myxarmorum]
MDNGQVCGRFRTSQLNKELVYSRKDKNSFRTLLASGFFSVLTFSSYKSLAQTKPETVQTDSIKNFSSKGKIAKRILPKSAISGTVLDENKLPLPGTKILIKGTSISTIADFDGYYKIEAKKDQTLIFSFPGYDTQEIIIQGQKIINLEFTLGEWDCGNLIVAGFPSYDVEADCERIKRKAKRKNARQEKREKIRNGELERSKMGSFFYKISHPFKKAK